MNTEVFQREDYETVRLFPGKLPIGVDKDGRDHAFLYLATRPHPWDFRLFLLRHVPLLQGVHRWRIRVLLPSRIRKAKALYLFFPDRIAFDRNRFVWNRRNRTSLQLLAGNRDWEGRFGGPDRDRAAEASRRRGRAA